MATAQLTASLISARSLASFRGLRPSNATLGSPAAVSLASRRSFPGLVVHAATAVAPKYASIKPLGEIVLMRIYNVEENTGGGILLATAAAQTNPQGDDDGG